MNAASYLGAREGRLAYLCFGWAYLLGYLLRSVNAVIAPDLVTDLGLSQSELGLLTAAYLASFGLMQLPVGLLLDRYGVRRVLSVLLLFAAAGALVFALAHSFVMLWFGRALIGVGTAGTLMASYKVFAERYPKERMPQLSAWVLLAGSIGALLSTVPTGMVLPLIGWRGVFVVVGLLIFLTVFVVLRLVPPALPVIAQPLVVQLASFKGIFCSAHFWQLAPVTLAFSGGFMALQGLWAGPWLADIGGLSGTAVAGALLVFNFALMCGHFVFGNVIVKLEKRGVALGTVLTAGLLLALGALGWIVLGGLPAWPPLPWVLLALSACTVNLTYAILARHFPLHLTGRLNTSINLLAFVGAFVFQAGIGKLLDLVTHAGLSKETAYSLAFGVVWLVELATFVWFLMGNRKQFSPAAEG